MYIPSYIERFWEEGYYLPTMVPWEVYHPGICLSPRCYLRTGNPGCEPPSAHGAAMDPVRARFGLTDLHFCHWDGGREASAQEKDASSQLRITAFPSINRSIMAKKPATESTIVQGTRESPNPSASDARPPLKSWPAF